MKKLKRIQKKYGNFIAQVISFCTMILVVCAIYLGALK